MNFKLNPLEIERYEKWRKSIPDKYTIANEIKIIFTINSGIGVGVDVECGKYKKDITDYSSW